MRRPSNVIVGLAVVIAMVVGAVSNAAVIYFCDEYGHVGSYDDVTTTVSVVGNLNSFSVGQVIGMAWDANTGRLLLLDRDGPAVYSMDPANGNATALFNPGISFQGGAVVGTTLYGIDEDLQTVEAFNLGTFANLNLTSAVLADHTHAMGVNPGTGQLYLGGGNRIILCDAAGNAGSTVVSASLNMEDLDYYGGDFLVAPYDDTITLVNGTTGAISTFLDASQTAAGGLTYFTTGVAVGGPAAPPSAAIPALGTVGRAALALSLLALGAWFAFRSRTA